MTMWYKKKTWLTGVGQLMAVTPGVEKDENNDLDSLFQGAPSLSFPTSLGKALMH